MRCVQDPAEPDPCHAENASTKSEDLRQGTDMQWLLEELDRIWFEDNIVSFHAIGTWIRSALWSFSSSSSSSSSSASSSKIAEKSKATPAQESIESIEMEQLVRPLRETGKVLSTGDLPRARLKRLSRRSFVEQGVAHRLFEDDGSSGDVGVGTGCSTSPEPLREVGMDSVLEDATLGVDDDLPSKKLQTIPSGFPLLQPDSSVVQPRRRRRRDRRKHTKSLSELELDELRGFRDLGFKLTKDDLTPRVVSLLPALKLQQPSVSSKAQPYRERIYPSHAWSIRRPDSPLLNLRMPDPHGQGVDMKAHLKFWARAVASTVRQEC